MSEAPIPSAVAIREELVRLFCNDLLGPAGGPEEEILENRVRERYLLGMLAPVKVVVAPEEQDELAAGGADSADEGSAEPSTVQTYTMFPSSLGLTFIREVRRASRAAAADPGGDGILLEEPPQAVGPAGSGSEIVAQQVVA